MVDVFAYLSLLILAYFAMYTIAKTQSNRKRRDNEEKSL